VVDDRAGVAPYPPGTRVRVLSVPDTYSDYLHEVGVVEAIDDSNPLRGRAKTPCRTVRFPDKTALHFRIDELEEVDSVREGG
jgi:hypothetical protein